MPTKALDLFQAYALHTLPQDGGYIVSSFFDTNSTYSRYEVVGYNGAKGIEAIDEGLQFQADGNKIFALVEPASYPYKHAQPVDRSRGEMVPYRFDELEIFTAKNQAKFMVSKKPIQTYSSFTILRPTVFDFAFVFFKLPDVIGTLRSFFSQTLSKEAALPELDAKRAADCAVVALKRFTVWQQ